METKEPSLLKPETEIYTSNLTGLAYIKSSKGGTANLYFGTHCRVNTKDNTVNLSYTVKAFESNWKDHVYFKTTNYKEAVDKYNELAIKWNGYREFIKES
jgi:pantothenate kinase